MLFRDLDSFHFGSIGKAFLTMLAMEIMTYTGMVLPNIYGCETFPLPGQDNCDPTVQGTGYVGIAYFVFGRIAGSLVLTTLCVGFVIQAFGVETEGKFHTEK